MHVLRTSDERFRDTDAVAVAVEEPRNPSRSRIACAVVTISSSSFFERVALVATRSSMFDVAALRILRSQ